MLVFTTLVIAQGFETQWLQQLYFLVIFNVFVRTRQGKNSQPVNTISLDTI